MSLPSTDFLRCSLRTLLNRGLAMQAAVTLVTFVASSSLQYAAMSKFIRPEDTASARHAFHAIGLIPSLGTGILVTTSVATAVLLDRLVTRKIVRLAAAARNRIESGGTTPFGVRSHITEVQTLSDVLCRLFGEQLARVRELVDLTTALRHDANALLTLIRIDAEKLAVTRMTEAESAKRLVLNVIRLADFLDTNLAITENYNQVNGAAREEIDMRELATMCVEMSEVVAIDKGVTLTLDLPEQPVSLFGHEQKLVTMLHNLIDNAVKYTPAGGSVAVRLHQTADAIQLVVDDTGCGISPEALPNIFKRGYRASNGGSGSGLGLAFVHSVVRLYRGTIVPESRPGFGTTFTITLPNHTKEIQK